MFATIAPYGRIQPGLATSDFEAVENYRQFIIVTSLSQSHIYGSYKLKVFVDINGNEFQVGSVAVLGRGKSTGCGNCQARRAAGTRVQGVISIHHGAIVGILESLTLNSDETSDENVIAAIKLSLRPRLFLPSGKVYSEPLPADTVGPEERQSLLPEEAEPSLRLMSCDVYRAVSSDGTGAKESPFDFHDWKDHDLVERQWVKRIRD